MGLRDISVALGGMMLLLLVACGTATKSFDHPTFGYTVTMPEDWQVEEEVADIDGATVPNLVRFSSDDAPHSSGEAWVTVMFSKGVTLSDSRSVQRMTCWSYNEHEFSDYGNSGYIKRDRHLFVHSWTDWHRTYYIEVNGGLYEIFYSPESARKKVFLTIDGYGTVITNSVTQWVPMDIRRSCEKDGV